LTAKNKIRQRPVFRHQIPASQILTEFTVV